MQVFKERDELLRDSTLDQQKQIYKPSLPPNTTQVTIPPSLKE